MKRRPFVPNRVVRVALVGVDPLAEGRGTPEHHIHCEIYMRVRFILLFALMAMSCPAKAEGGKPRTLTVVTYSMLGSDTSELREDGLLVSKVARRGGQPSSSRRRLPAGLVRDIFNGFDAMTSIDRNELKKRNQNRADGQSHHLTGTTKSGKIIKINWSENLHPMPTQLQIFSFLWELKVAPVITFLSSDPADPVGETIYEITLDGRLRRVNGLSAADLTTLPYRSVQKLLLKAGKLQLKSGPLIRRSTTGAISRFTVRRVVSKVQWNDEVSSPEAKLFFEELMGLAVKYDKPQSAITLRKKFMGGVAQETWKINAAGRASRLLDGASRVQNWEASPSDTALIFAAFDHISIADQRTLDAAKTTNSQAQLAGKTSDGRQLDLHWDQAVEANDSATLKAFLALFEQKIRQPYESSNAPGIWFQKRDDDLKIDRSFVLYFHGELFEIRGGVNRLIAVVSADHTDTLMAEGTILGSWGDACGIQIRRRSSARSYYLKKARSADQIQLECRWTDDWPAAKEVQEYFEMLMALVPSNLEAGVIVH